jgi:predicted phage terminase large subunit-like protein
MDELTPEQKHAVQEELAQGGHFPSFVLVMHRALRAGAEFKLKDLHLAIFEFLEECYAGRVLDGYINIPPRHGKTYLICLWIAFCYAMRSDCRFIYATYGAELAEASSMLIQQIMQHEKYKALFKTRIDPKAAAREKFQTTKAGIFLARGITGTVTGYGAGLIDDIERFSGALIFDDLHKPGEAASEAQKKEVATFMTDVFMSRRNNSTNVPMIGIGQRVAVDDVFGLLDPRDENDVPLGNGHTGLTGAQWTRLLIPVIGKDGKPIFPEVMSETMLANMKVAKPWLYDTQYMQRPYSTSGTMFKVDLMPILHTRPDGPFLAVRAWDLASRKLRPGQTEPDWTAYVKLVYYFKHKLFVIEDAGQFRDTPEVVRARMLNTAHLDGLEVLIRGAQDPGQAGVDQVTTLIKMLVGYKANFPTNTGDKVTRADPLSTQFNVGLVACLAPYAEFVRKELRGFPFAKHDDFVDALAYAFAEIAIPDEETASARAAAAALMAAARFNYGEGMERETKEQYVEQLKPGYFPEEGAV